MDNIFSQYLDKFILIFIDDILIYSRTKEEHEEHRILLLQTLREHKIYAKFIKCDFYQKNIQYVGHIIFEDGLAVDPKTDTELLTTKPILKVPNMDKEFLVSINASKEGLGGVLMQEGRVMTYISRKLRRSEYYYATHNLELLAIVYSLRVWRHYLIGWKFELKTDHSGLQHIFTHSDLNARQRRWS